MANNNITINPDGSVTVPNPVPNPVPPITIPIPRPSPNPSISDYPDVVKTPSEY